MQRRLDVQNRNFIHLLLRRAVLISSMLAALLFVTVSMCSFNCIQADSPNMHACCPHKGSPERHCSPSNVTSEAARITIEVGPDQVVSPVLDVAVKRLSGFVPAFRPLFPTVYPNDRTYLRISVLLV